MRNAHLRSLLCNRGPLTSYYRSQGIDGSADGSWLAPHTIRVVTAHARNAQRIGFRVSSGNPAFCQKLSLFGVRKTMITSRNPEVAHECFGLLALNAFDNLQAHSRRIESLCDDMATLPTMPEGHQTTVFLLQEFIRVVAEFFRYQENLMERLGYPDL